MLTPFVVKTEMSEVYDKFESRRPLGTPTTTDVKVDE